LKGSELGAKVFAEGFRRLQELRGEPLGSRLPTRVLADRRVVAGLATVLLLALVVNVASGWDSRSSNSPNINTVPETVTQAASDFSLPIDPYPLPRFADVVSRDIQTMPIKEGINLKPVSSFTPVRFRIDVQEGVNVRYSPDQESDNRVKTDQDGYVYKALPNGDDAGVYSEFVVRKDDKSGEITIFAARAGEKGLEYLAIYANGWSLVKATIESFDPEKKEIEVQIEDMFRKDLSAQTPQEAPVIK